MWLEVAPARASPTKSKANGIEIKNSCKVYKM